MSDDQRVDVRKRMGMCFQGSALFNSISVGENVALPLRETVHYIKSFAQTLSEQPQVAIRGKKPQGRK